MQFYRLDFQLILPRGVDVCLQSTSFSVSNFRECIETTFMSSDGEISTNVLWFTASVASGKQSSRNRKGKGSLEQQAKNLRICGDNKYVTLDDAMFLPILSAK